MGDEHIKEIVVAAINNDLIWKYNTNEQTAEELAKFINTLMEKVGNQGKGIQRDVFFHT